MGKKPSKKGFGADDLARIDKLLAQIPDDEADAPKPQPGPAEPGSKAAVPRASRGAQIIERTTRRYPRLGAWLRVSAGLVLALAMTQWPYAHACGLGLTLYLAAVTAVLLAGAWAGVHTWRARVAIPHLMAQGVVLWGVALAAHQVLPRVGYAKAEASWQCRAEQAPPAVASPGAAATAPLPAAITPLDSVVPGDSSAPRDSLAPTDSVPPADSVMQGDSVTPPIR